MYDLLTAGLGEWRNLRDTHLAAQNLLTQQLTMVVVPDDVIRSQDPKLNPYHHLLPIRKKKKPF